MTIRRRWLLLVLIGAALAYGGYLRLRPAHVGPPPPEVELTGIDARVAAAVRGARQEVVEAPGSAAAWGRLGQVLLAHEFNAQAQQCLARAEELDPRDPRWPYLQARMNAVTNPLTEAKLRRAIDVCDAESVPGPLLHLGDWLLSRGRGSDAEAEFHRSLAAAPNNPWALLGLAKVALARDDLPAARAALAVPTVRQVVPKSYHALRAAVALRAGDAAEAELESRRSRVSPRDPDPPDRFSAEVVALGVGLRADLNRAEGLINRGGAVDALGLLEDLVRVYPDAVEAWLTYGRALLQAQDPEGAERAGATAARLAPASAQAHWLHGTALARRGQPADAVKSLRRAIECEPAFWAAYPELGQALVQTGDQDGALATVSDWVRHAPQQAQAHRVLGELLLKANRPADAVRHLRDALTIDPDDATAKALLTRAEGAPPPK